MKEDSHRLLPREVVETLYLEIFKVMLNGVLGNLVQLRLSLLTAEGWGVGRVELD